MNSLHANIFIFNPTCEYSIANGNENWNPNRILQKMEADLSALPMFFALKNDYVLVDSIPSERHLNTFKKISIEIPKFISKKDSLKDNNFILAPKNKLIPWGWSPAVHKILLPFKKSCSKIFHQSPVYNWTEKHKEISSRKFAAEILSEVLKYNNSKFLPPAFLPRICTQKSDYEKAFQDWGKVMIKAPWSSSGRGLQKITKQPIHEKVWEKLLGIVREQGYAMAEPLLDKRLDLAQQFEIVNGKVKYLGTSFFSADNKGQYQGNYLNGLPQNTDKKVVDFIYPILDETRELLKKVIQESDLTKYYEGPLGVDMLVYSDENNRLKINPCLEINVRSTMGQLALKLEKFIHPDKKGVFFLFFQPGQSYYDFSSEMEKKHPPFIFNNLIESGFFTLTEPTKESLFGAYILV